ncbi:MULTISPECIES: Cro/Cl family transcriptional regulator [Leclercia]|jgi:hypothetical protein|uniref:Cro/Cl family transcriptional regulator n=1 Tax=Leclercia TaxID=83654 RepID=UPI0012E30216|nr:Cro/Cl family transcriptional regulator [Leclercia sp. J807]MCK2286002.1 Cro/Cl family transcriptional regulator [Escherichia coli]MDU6817805.1 Cro/Cl family transcriptional regulator [Leclercia adecarboxylata]QGU10648.1 Cro/Cl family transcriptional regulator [Leclercia sp. J807]HAZ6604240.1 Cro/Cl family transcriptional regulator [Escherichia coli]
MQITTLGDVIRTVRVSVVAKACDRTPRAIYKWIARGALPRTDFTDETDYAGKIAAASGGKYSAEEIRNISKPQ